MSQSESIHLAADLSFLHTDYLWRMPGSWVGYDYYSTSDFYEDIARIALFLASDESRMITGASIPADGGRSAY